MYTYQDLLSCVTEDSRKGFLIKAIEQHKASTAYRIAADAEAYYSKRNVTISKYQKFLRTVTGRQIPDTFSSNYKLKTQFFRRFVTQQVQYVLSNGVTFEEESTKAAMGKTFDNRIQTAAAKAMVDGVAFGFFNRDHVEIFSLVDTASTPGFVPLYDVKSSQLMAGIRYWYTGPDIDTLTLHITLYEIDGFTNYIRLNKNTAVETVDEKQAYKVDKAVTGAGEIESVEYSNYAGFPIVPLYANDLHESELIGIRESIDCYDFIKSGLANEIDDTSGFYWTIKNNGGMDDIDLAQFIERMKTIKAAVIDDDSGAAEAHTLDVPVEARAKMLEILKQDLYEDFQLLNVNNIAAGQKTATEIRAAYQPQDDKCGAFEFELIEFIQGLLKIAGIDDNPSFKYNRIANMSEETNMIMAAAQYLDVETILNKLPWLTPEEAQAVIERKAAEDSERLLGREYAEQLAGENDDETDDVNV